jgi:hypothetical protein
MAGRQHIAWGYSNQVYRTKFTASLYRKVQTAAAKKEEQLRSAALTLAARRSDADSIGRILVPVVKKACTEALEQRPVEHPEPTSIMIPGIEGFLNKHLLPYGTAINGLIKTAGHLQTLLATASTAHKGAAHLELLIQNSLAPLPQWQEDIGVQRRQLQEGQQALANRYMSGNVIARFCLLRSIRLQRSRTFLCRCCHEH